MKAVALRSVRKVQGKELMGRFTQVVRRRLGSRSSDGKAITFTMLTSDLLLVKNTLSN